MAVIREDLEKKRALERVEKILEQVKNCRKCIDILQGDAEISVTVKPAGSKRGARVDSGLEDDAARLSAIMVGAVKRMAKAVNRDAAKYDIELSEDEVASLSFEENKMNQPASAEQTEVLTNEENNEMSAADDNTGLQQEGAEAPNAQDKDDSSDDSWSGFGEDTDSAPERQSRRFFGL